MDILEIQEKFEDLLLADPDFDESLLEKDEEGCYSDSDIQYMYSTFEAGAEVGEQWQASKAQAVPDTYTPIVLALEDVQSKIAQASFLTMDADNENEVYAVDANELHEYIDELIEAQEPK